MAYSVPKVKPTAFKPASGSLTYTHSLPKQRPCISALPIAMGQILPSQQHIDPKFRLNMLLSSLSSNEFSVNLRLLACRLPLLFPVFERLIGLAVDQRFHGGEIDFFTHSLNAVEELSSMEVNTGLPRGAIILGLATLLHDIGKSIDIQKISGDRVSYYNHQCLGKKEARKILENINTQLEPANRLSAAQIDLICKLIEVHMEGLNIARELSERTDAMESQMFLHAKARSFSRNLCTGQMLNHPFEIEDVIRAGLLIAEMEIRAGRGESREGILERFNEFKAYVEDNINSLVNNIRESYLVPLVDGHDLEKLAVPEKERSPLLKEINQKQRDGELTSRKQALQFIADKLGVNFDPAMLGQVKTTARLEQERPIGSQQCNSYEIIEFESAPMVQFKDPKTFASEFNTALESGCYPLLSEYISARNLQLFEIAALFFKRGFSNMAQLESWLKLHPGEELEQVQVTKGTSRAFAIRRQDGLLIDLPLGWQSLTEHVGKGVVHISEQRRKDLTQLFKTADESIEQMEQRYMQKTIEILGTSLSEMPSDYDVENKRILLGKIADGQYSAVVIEMIGANRARIVTSIFAPDEKYLKNMLLSYFNRLIDAKCSEAKLLDAIKSINAFLSAQGFDWQVIRETLTGTAAKKASASAPAQKPAGRKQEQPGFITGAHLSNWGIQPGPMLGKLLGTAKKAKNMIEAINLIENAVKEQGQNLNENFNAFKQRALLINAIIYAKTADEAEAVLMTMDLPPELTALKGLGQGDFIHFEGDVFFHTILALRQTIDDPAFAGLSEEEKIILKLAALMHDMGKGKARLVQDKIVEGKLDRSFPGHDKASVELAQDMLSASPLVEPSRELCRLLLRNHMLMYGINTETLEKYFLDADLKENHNFQLLMVIMRADRKATWEDAQGNTTYDRYFDNSGNLKDQELIEKKKADIRRRRANAAKRKQAAELSGAYDQVKIPGEEIEKIFEIADKKQIGLIMRTQIEILKEIQTKYRDTGNFAFSRQELALEVAKRTGIKIK